MRRLAPAAARRERIRLFAALYDYLAGCTAARRSPVEAEMAAIAAVKLELFAAERGGGWNAVPVPPERVEPRLYPASADRAPLDPEDRAELRAAIANVIAVERAGWLGRLELLDDARRDRTSLRAGHSGRPAKDKQIEGALGLADLAGGDAAAAGLARLAAEPLSRLADPAAVDRKTMRDWLMGRRPK